MPGDVGRASGDAGAHRVCEVKTLDHTALQVRSSGEGTIGRFFREGYGTGRSENAQVHCLRRR